jgi:hypothetical protein
MRNRDRKKRRILVFASLSGLLILAYLNNPIYMYGNSNTVPGFVTIGDTVSVELPEIQIDGRWKKFSI